WHFPVAEQPRDAERRTERTQRWRQRHARHGTFARSDDGCRAGGVVVRAFPASGADGGPPDLQRLRAGWCGCQSFAALRYLAGGGAARLQSGSRSVAARDAVARRGRSTMKRIAVIGLGQRIAHVLVAMKEVGWDFAIVGYSDPAPVGLPIL